LPQKGFFTKGIFRVTTTNGGRLNNFSEIIFSQTGDLSKNAYFFQGKGTTYSDLSIQSRKMATYFLRLGIDDNKKILIFLDDSPALAFCFLAAAQIGSIPILLNPRSKARIVSHYLDSSAASAIICEAENSSDIQNILAEKNLNLPIILQDLYPISQTQDLSSGTPLKLSDALSLRPHEDFSQRPDDPIIWQYTSGTTGLPKAIPHNLKGILHSNEVYAKQVLNISSDSKLYSTARLFFGYGLGNSVFFNLLNRATSYIDRRWPDERSILENLVKFGPTHFFSVPNLYARLLEDTERLSHAIKDTSFFVSAGSPLPSDTFRKWKSRFSAEILDGIGATEVGHIFLSNRCGTAKPGTTGKPLAGYDVKLIREDGDEATDLISGELWVKGPSVSSGYCNIPDYRKQRFVEGWYKTGDKFVRDEEGNYRYLGRIDDMFKSKGRWIHPQEIEDHLKSNLSWLDEVALLPTQPIDSDPILCLTKIENAPPLELMKEEIADYIVTVFGSYCKPVEYRELKYFPRNDNGKILRSELLNVEPACICLP